MHQPLTGAYVAVVLVAMIALVAFHYWLAHCRRTMIHRERMAAIEKGLELPSLDHELQRRSFNVQRLLILTGLIWVFLAIGLFIFLRVVAGGPPVQIPWEAHRVTAQIPMGMQWIAVAPFGIGLAHLLVYFIGRRKES
jgi:hypothetical protein